MKKLLLPRFPKWVGFTIATLLTVAEAVQIHISMSEQAHAGISMFIAVAVSAGVVPITGSAFVAKLPVEVVHIIGAILGAILIFQSNIPGSSETVQTIIAAVVVIAGSLGLAPTVATGQVQQPVEPAA